MSDVWSKIDKKKEFEEVLKHSTDEIYLGKGKYMLFNESWEIMQELIKEKDPDALEAKRIFESVSPYNITKQKRLSAVIQEAYSLWGMIFPKKEILLLADKWSVKDEIERELWRFQVNQQPFAAM